MTDDFKYAFESYSSVVKMESKPGVPLMLFTATKETALQNHYSLIRWLVWRRLKLMAQLDAEVATSTRPGDLIEQGWSDPLKVFPKQEATPMRKLMEGRERNRLIQNISLTHEILERFLMYNYTKTEIFHHARRQGLRPAALNGVGFDHKSSETVAFRVGKMRDPAYSDIEAFDWSVRKWQYDVDMEVKFRCIEGEKSAELRQVYKNQSFVMMRKCFVFSDGSAIMQSGKDDGIQITGSFNTGSGNSGMRSYAYFGARLKLGMSLDAEIFDNGDDAVEDFVPGIVPVYRSLGLNAREYKTSKVIDFCSHMWDPTGTYKPRPTGVVKMLVGYLFSRVGPQEDSVVRSLCDELVSIGPQDEEHPMVVAVLGSRFIELNGEKQE